MIDGIKIGVQLFSLRRYLKNEKCYDEVFKQVKAMGAEVVQVSCTLGRDVSADMLKQVSQKYALPICVTHSPIDRIKHDLDNLAQEHIAFGCKDIGIGIMPKEYRDGTKEGITKFIQMLNTASQRLENYDMHIAYHNHWFEFGKVDGEMIFDRLIDETNKRVRFIPDTFWIQVGGQDPSNFLQKLDGRVDTMHLKDYKKLFGVPVFRAIGKGVQDFDKILSMAKKIGIKNAVVELDISPNAYKSMKYSMNTLMQKK